MKSSIVALATIIVTMTIHAVGQNSPVSPDREDGPAQVSVSSAHTSPALHERNPRYTLRKGDTVDLDFALSPEFNQTVAVQPDGYVALKGVGSILVEGQTVPELTETVKVAYAKILHDPVVAIALKDFEKPYFIASGQVSKPGKYDLRSDLTLTEAVAIAGGFNDKAKHSQVVLFRPVPDRGGYEAKLIDAKKLLATHNLAEDPQIRPGDMIYVPQSTFSKIRPFLPTTSMGMYYNPAIY